MTKTIALPTLSILTKIFVPLLIVAACATNVKAGEATQKALAKELKQQTELLQPCMAGLARAQRNDNVWQETDLSIEECKARAMELQAIGLRMLGSAFVDDDTPKCGDKIEVDGKCYNSLGDVPGRTRGGR